MSFKKVGKSIQTTGYNGALTVGRICKGDALKQEELTEILFISLRVLFVKGLLNKYSSSLNSNYD